MEDELTLLAARAQARVGTSLRGKWVLDRVIGVGAMAAVYECTHRNGTRAAVKILHGEAALDPEVRRRFAREGTIANRIQHPGVVRVFDDDDDGGTAFLVMELLEGRTVQAEFLAYSRRMPTVRVIQITDWLLDVLDAAHAAGVVHRDIKPDNLFLTSTGLKVLDFGIARLADSIGKTKGGQMMGTPEFMAPEQTGKANQVDARADIFSTGAMMFTLLSGQPVHVARSALDYVVMVATRPARSLSDVLPFCEDGVVKVVDKALAFNRDDRWTSAKEMQVALRSAAGAIEPTAAGLSVQLPASIIEARRRSREPQQSSPEIPVPTSSTKTLPLKPK